MYSEVKRVCDARRGGRVRVMYGEVGVCIVLMFGECPA